MNILIFYLFFSLSFLYLFLIYLFLVPRAGRRRLSRVAKVQGGLRHRQTHRVVNAVGGSRRYGYRVRASARVDSPQSGKKSRNAYLPRSLQRSESAVDARRNARCVRGPVGVHIDDAAARGHHDRQRRAGDAAWRAFYRGANYAHDSAPG